MGCVKLRLIGTYWPGLGHKLAKTFPAFTASPCSATKLQLGGANRYVLECEPNNDINPFSPIKKHSGFISCMNYEHPVVYSP